MWETTNSYPHSIPQQLSFQTAFWYKLKNNKQIKQNCHSLVHELDSKLQHVGQQISFMQQQTEEEISKSYKCRAPENSEDNPTKKNKSDMTKWALQIR